jgi:predicted ATPase
MTLNIHLLGQFKLTAGDQEIDLPSRPAQTLLAYLVLNAGVTHRREKLANMIWPESNETNARSYLRQALWRIRKSLENYSVHYKSYLGISDISITFKAHSDYWLDAEILLSPVTSMSVEEMISVVELYRGELLPGFYEEWIILERDRLQAAYHQKMNHLLNSLIQDMQWDDAIFWAEQWIRFGYSPEPAFRAMMRAYAGLGDQTMVSSTYQRCRDALDRELSLEPSPETQQLLEELLQVEPDHVEILPIQKPDFSIIQPSFLNKEPYFEERSNFVAREREIARLDHFRDMALNGHGQVVFITGEAGSGKTSLIQEFTQRSLTANDRSLANNSRESGFSSQVNLIIASGNCNAHTGIGDPYLPFREIMELLTGDVESRWAAGAITREQAHALWKILPVTIRALVDSGPNLVDTFVSGSALQERAKAFASTMRVSCLDELIDRITRNLTISNPQQQDLFEQYTRVLTTLARSEALVLVIDDLQWADLGSISLLFHLGRQVPGNRILILGAYRPEEIALGRDGDRHPLEAVVNEFQRMFGDNTVNLDQADSAQFISELLDSEPNRLGYSFREMLHAQTLGQPLFTIELLRGMQERGDMIQDQSGKWMEGPALDWETMPARVEAVVAERINRLDQPLQATLRLASVEGETFTAEVIARVQAMNEQELLTQLSSELNRKHRLIRAQSILRVDGQLLSSYRFRHILTQRYLYSRLDEVERVYLHEQVGTALEALYGSRDGASGTEIVSIAPKLARHFQGAKNTNKAIHYLRQAGERALQLSAYQEALNHLNKGLELLMTLPVTPEHAEMELALQQILGMAWVGPSAYGEEVKKTYNRVYQLCQQLGKTTQLCLALGQLSVQSFVQSEYQKAYELALESLNIAQQADDPMLIALGHWHLGFISFILGENITAQAHFKQVTDFYNPEQHHRKFLLLRGSDGGISSLSYEACVLWCLGYPDQAKIKSQETLSMARKFKHPFTLADALCYGGCWFNAMQRDIQALREYAKELTALANELRFAGWYETGECFYGESLAMMDQVEEGIRRMRQSIAENELIGVRCSLVGSFRALAEAHLKEEQLDQGLSTLDKAFALVKKTGERLWEAELFRLHGEFLRLDANENGAEASFKKAIEVAQGQRAKSWELRAATSLAWLWKDRGKCELARERLGKIYNWFTEGFDTPDLQKAKSLLDSLH